MRHRLASPYRLASLTSTCESKAWTCKSFRFPPRAPLNEPQQETLCIRHRTSLSLVTVYARSDLASLAAPAPTRRTVRLQRVPARQLHVAAAYSTQSRALFSKRNGLNSTLSGRGRRRPHARRPVGHIHCGRAEHARALVRPRGDSDVCRALLRSLTSHLGATQVLRQAPVGARLWQNHRLSASEEGAPGLKCVTSPSGLLSPLLTVPTVSNGCEQHGRTRSRWPGRTRDRRRHQPREAPVLGQAGAWMREGQTVLSLF